MDKMRVAMEEPEQFHFANAFRMYGTPTEVVIEFARSRPLTPDQPHNLSAKGLVGIVMSIPAANSFLEQLRGTIASSLASGTDVVKVDASGAVQTDRTGKA